MTLPMIIALAVTVLMIILIMVDKLPFGAPPLLALLLLVVFGVTDIKTAFGGFANPTIVMLASFMAIIAALQKTSFIVKFKQTMFNMASKGGFKAYVLLILIVMLGCSLFGTGSTAYIVKEIANAPSGSAVAVGTEINLVNRLAAQYPDKTVFCLDPVVCPCSTMYRIHPAYLAWALENIEQGNIVNRITVDDATARDAKIALQRMLEVHP